MFHFLMKISLGFYLSLFLLLILIFSFCLKKYTPSPLYTESQPVIEHALQGIKAKRFDKAGHLLQELHVTSWFHYQNELVSHLLSPNLTLYYSNGESCNVFARKGQSYQKQIHGKLEKLQLSDDVTVVHSSTPNSWYELKTKSILFFPYESTATTDDPVVITSSAMKINALGMRANLKDHSIKLVKNVKSVYEPNKS